MKSKNEEIKKGRPRKNVNILCKGSKYQHKYYITNKHYFQEKNQKHFQENKYKIYRNALIRRIEEGKNVRLSTLITYGITEKEYNIIKQ